ncbi:MAG: hypothetical protein LC732_08815 [Acidobacteria bacterium]|nr:hypothetical protein [Acidobacteriota bacterium]
MSRILVGVGLLLLATGCAGPSASDRGAPAIELPRFVPEDVRAFQGPQGVEVYFIRRDEVLVVIVPYATSDERAGEFQPGKEGAVARRFTGENAGTIAPPAGAADPARDLLEVEVATAGSFTAEGLKRRGEYRSHGEDSLRLTVTRLQFPGGSPFRIDSVSAPVWVYPP